MSETCGNCVHFVKTDPWGVPLRGDNGSCTAPVPMTAYDSMDEYCYNDSTTRYRPADDCNCYREKP